MAGQTIANALVEYDNTGAPTGVVVIDGKRVSYTTFSALESFPVPSGTPSGTKFLIARNVLVSTPERTTVGVTASVQDEKGDFQTITA